MKSINGTPVKALMLSFAIVFTTLMATAGTGDKDKKNSIPVELSYIGNINQSPVFQLALENETGEKLYISVRNQSGDVLYATSFKGKNFSKKIRFDNADMSDMQLKLVITSKTKFETQHFHITQQNRVIEEITVAKVL